MKKLNFSTHINAPKEKVWNVLWEDGSYRAWTNAFADGSYAKTDNWKEGTKVLFLGPNGDGMVSMVTANKPNEYMSFKHLGEVKEGVEDTSGGWSGAMENYILKEENGKTTLEVEMDSTDELSEYFSETWPKALEKVKQLSE